MKTLWTEYDMLEKISSADTFTSGLLLAFLGLLRNYLVLKWLMCLFLNM